MSGKPKPVRKLLPVIPAGVEPAVSPGLARSKALLPRASTSSVSKTCRDAGKNQIIPRAKELPAAPSLKAYNEGEDSSVQVAVRVRPFSKRELVLGANQVVSMNGNRTTITSNKGKAHFFSYDHSFWSMGKKVGGADADFASQEHVYKELAQPLLDSSFRGYNTCLFAYGQTGSGKSYCIMGEGQKLGIVPRFMRELFERIEGTSDSKNTYNVQVSYFEIYNEKVYDLLKSSGHTKHKFKLRVREHQVLGPYVEDLSTYVTTSYADIEHWLMVGNRCRATSATSMNDRSSRSHAVFSITLTHTTVEEEEEHNTVSRINIIDLAGSERSKVAETSGEQLKEGASINRSLHSLGKVISLLSDRSTGKRDKLYIPYRDSTLTWLLKESLGGNSKTAMIATISPADLHYEESLSTLRYAQQARNIVNVARVNEDPNVKMIRELTSEILQLRELLALQGGDAGLTEIKKLKDQLSESEKLMSEATRSWKEKLYESEQRKKEELEQLKLTGALVVNNKLPNLVNLTEDPQLSETLLYVLRTGRTTVGNRSSGGVGAKLHDIELTGALVTQDHCVLVHEGTSVHMEPSDAPEAQTYVNGQLLSSPISLHHGDRIVLGGDYFFRFNYPLEVEGTSSGKKGHKDFEFARNELIKAQTERVEREWQEKILKERQQMLLELEDVQHSAQAEMNRQQTEYQLKIESLSKVMDTQSQHLTAELQTKQEAELRMEELRRQNQILEEETIAQRHIIHLEKIKTEQESRELEEQRNQLMLDLEQEKQRLEDDIDKMHRNKNMRNDSHLSPPSSCESLLVNSQSSGSDLSLLHRGSEVMRISVMLQEATAICKALNKPLTFSREEGGSGLCVRVSNNSFNTCTYWDMNKFEARLEQMRELYQTRGSANSLDDMGTSSPSFIEDPFNDPSDGWGPSPLRSLQRTRSLSLQSTPSLATPTSVNRPLHFDLYHTLSSKSSHLNSPLLAATPPQDRPHTHTATPLHGRPLSSTNHTVTAVLRQMSQLLDWRESCSPGGVWNRMFEAISTIGTECEELTQLFKNGGDGVEGPVVALCCALEILVEDSKLLHEVCLQWRSYMPHYPLMEHTSGVDVTVRLQQTLCHQTALYCTKLMKGGGGDLAECCEEVQASLDSVTELVAQVMLVREIQQKLLSSSSHEEEEGTTHSLPWPAHEVSNGVKVCLQRGVSSRCVSVLDCVLQCLQENLSTINTSSSPSLGEWLTGIRSLITSACSFLQWLQDNQEFIWSGDPELLPPSPMLMLLTLHKVASSVSTLSHTFSDDGNSSAGTACAATVTHCKHLAVAVLGMLKTSQAGKELVPQVQSYSLKMIQAGKILNQLMKSNQVLR